MSGVINLTYDDPPDQDVGNSSDNEVQILETEVNPLKKAQAEMAALEAQLAEKRLEVKQRMGIEQQADAKRKQAMKEEEAKEKELKAKLQKEAQEKENASRELADHKLTSLMQKWNEIHVVVQQVVSLHDMQSAIPPDVRFADMIGKVDQVITDKPVQPDEEPLPQTFEQMVKESEKWLKQSWVDLMMASASMKKYIFHLKTVLRQEPYCQKEEVIDKLTITPFEDQVKQDEALMQKDATIEAMKKEIEDLKARVQGPKVPKVSVNRPKVLKAPVKGPEDPKAPVKVPNEKKRKLNVQGSGNDAKKPKTGPNPIFFGSVMKPTNTVYKVVYQGLRTKGKQVPKDYQRNLRSAYLQALKGAWIGHQLKTFSNIRSKYGAPKHAAFRAQMLQLGTTRTTTPANNLKKIILAGVTTCGGNTYNFTPEERNLCDTLSALWKKEPALQPSFEIDQRDIDACLEEARTQSLAMQEAKSKDQTLSATPANQSPIPSPKPSRNPSPIPSPKPRDWSLD